MTILPSVRGEIAGQRGEVDGHGHHEALGVVGVLADQVYAAGRNKDGRFGMEAGNMHGTKSGGIVHFSQNLSIEIQNQNFITPGLEATVREH